MPKGVYIRTKSVWNKGTKGLCKPNSGSFRKGTKVSKKDKKKRAEGIRRYYDNGGFGPMTGQSPSKETRNKISKALKGKIVSEETKEKLSKANTGKHRSEKTKEKMKRNHKGTLGKHWKLSSDIKQKMSEFRKGKKLSEKHKNKISKSNKGRIVSFETRKKISESNKGRKCSKEVKKRISESQKGKHNSPKTEFKKGTKQSLEVRTKRSNSMKGKNTKNKDGICITFINEQTRKSFEYKIWRESIFKRDNYTCQECGSRNGNGKKIVLNAHHIKSFANYPKLRFVVSNGKTLCKNCHLKTDTYGNKNNIKNKEN